MFYFSLKIFKILTLKPLNLKRVSRFKGPYGSFSSTIVHYITVYRKYKEEIEFEFD